MAINHELRPSPDWIQKLKAAVRTRALRGDYKGGLEIAREARQKYPKEFECRYLYAKMLGDWADELPLAKQLKLKKEAARLLAPLTRALSGKPPLQRFGVCVNYYYQSFKVRELFQYGQRLTRKDDRQGWYAQGLAACLVADQLRSKDPSGAIRWARRSIHAWECYDLTKEPYYFSHYTLAKAFAIAGENRKALTSLQRAARLSKRSLEDWEFKDVLELLRAAHG